MDFPEGTKVLVLAEVMRKSSVPGSDAYLVKIVSDEGHLDQGPETAWSTHIRPVSTIADLIDKCLDLDEESLNYLFVNRSCKEGSGLFINCNDQFCWGCADAEPLTEENFPLLEQAFKDCMEATGSNDVTSDAFVLFVARLRKTRPQGAMYHYLEKELWPLFDAAGPEREVGLGNPFAPGEYNPKYVSEERKTLDELKALMGEVEAKNKTLEEVFSELQRLISSRN